MEEKYYEWLIESIDPLGTARDYYQPVLRKLYSTDFRWSHRFEDDRNRAEDGLTLRTIFADVVGLDVADLGLNETPCSCLEMMVAIARRIELEILSMPGEDDIPKWFWRFIEGLGLGAFKPEIDTESYIERRINLWLDRKYYRNGYGGIFVVHDDFFDMRKMTIWKQMNAVLNEEMDF